jgi:DNA-binding CsgD family transcriptional regulator
MLPGQKELSKLLESLYDAASDANLWEPFLQQLAHTCEARSSALVMFSRGHDLYSVSGLWGIDPESSVRYQQYYGPLDIWASRSFSKPTGYSFTSDSIIRHGELVQTEIYNDFFLKYGVAHGLFGVVDNSANTFVSMSLFRSRSDSPFDVCDTEILTFLGPHLQRAFRLHCQFSELTARCEGLEKALDALAIGVIFFGANGQIVLANRAASSLMNEHDGLLATRDGLGAERQTESSLLKKLIFDAVSTANGKGLGPGGMVLVSRSKRPPLQIMVSPIRSLALQFSQPIAAVAFLIDPAKRLRPTTEVLRAMFGLTPAECRVALLLVDGHAPRLIAQMVGVTDHTVRSQIKSIYSKTGVRRQSELVRLLLSISGNSTPR